MICLTTNECCTISYNVEQRFHYIQQNVGIFSSYDHLLKRLHYHFSQAGHKQKQSFNFTFPSQNDRETKDTISILIIQLQQTYTSLRYKSINLIESTV